MTLAPEEQLGATRNTPDREASSTPSLTGIGHRAVLVIPGLLLTGVIATAAFALRQIPGLTAFSPMILAILIGIILHNSIGAPRWAQAGIKFSLRRILRAAIILLGLQLTIIQVIELGVSGLAIVVASLLMTFAFTTWIGDLLAVDRKLVQLIAAGTSICGASAVIATNVVTNATDEDAAYAVACVTVFGSIAMFGYPLLPGLLHLDPHSFGLWSGSSIHEIAQVVAAAFQDGQQAGEFGTIAKLSRVIMLAPMVISIGILETRRTRETGRDNGGSAARPPVPWFVVGFIILVGINSIITIPADIKAWIVVLTTFMLSMALAAMGLETDIRKLAAKGFRPALVAAFAFLFISCFSLTLIKLIG
jgi:uncharacterized integral membrane protein (TIGR00698 family)